MGYNIAIVSTKLYQGGVGGRPNRYLKKTRKHSETLVLILTTPKLSFEY